MLDPTRIYNMDETAFHLTPKSDKVITKKGAKTVHVHVGNDDKECLTTMVAGNAAGMLPPPMVLHTQKRIPYSIIKDTPADWGLGRSDSGWMTGQTFYEYISNVFYKWLCENKIKLPVILFVDGHKSHLTINVSEFCREHEIVLVALYPNATHMLQPMDVAVFKPLKVAWRHEIQDWRIKNNAVKIKKGEFAGLLKNSMEKTDMKSHLQNGFKACGLFPFNADNIPYGKLLVQPGTTASNSAIQNEATTIAPVGVCVLEDASITVVSNENNLLQGLERNIDCEILKKFKESDQFWNGDIEYGELFVVWHRLSQSAAVVEQEMLTQFIDEPMRDEENPHVDKTVVVLDHSPIAPTVLTAPTVMDDAPSPFKKSFFWKEADEAGPSTATKIKIPSVATSDEWMMYHKKRQAEKDLIEETKAEKRRKILEKKQIAAHKKEHNNIEKAKKELHLEKKKKKLHLDTASEITVDDYVIFTYEEAFFPGKVISASETDVEILSMTFSGVSHFKWPENNDQLWYKREDVLEVIKPPTPLNKRGAFIVPEMTKYRK